MVDGEIASLRVETNAILLTGNLSQPGEDMDANTIKVIEILSQTASLDPLYLLESIQNAIHVRIDSMVSTALCILLCRASADFLRKHPTRLGIIDILKTFGPARLLQTIELMRCKGFGRGFGSRIQKLIRLVMEEWQLETIQTYLSRHPRAFYSLVRLVHPRYNGARGIAIKAILEQK